MTAVLNDSLNRLRELEERINLHTVFRQQRLRSLGWSQKQPEEQLQITSNSPVEDSSSQLLRNYDEMKEQLLQILQSPETRAFIHLMNRLSMVSRELQKNVILWLSECGEYSEAQRLRQINNSIQNTFYEQCAGGEDDVMDRIHTISRGSELLITELERLADKKRRFVDVHIFNTFYLMRKITLHSLIQSGGSNSYASVQSIVLAAKKLVCSKFCIEIRHPMLRPVHNIEYSPTDSGLGCYYL